MFADLFMPLTLSDLHTAMAANWLIHGHVQDWAQMLTVIFLRKQVLLQKYDLGQLSIPIPDFVGNAITTLMYNFCIFD